MRSNSGSGAAAGGRRLVLALAVRGRLRRAEGHGPRQLHRPAEALAEEFAQFALDLARVHRPGLYRFHHFFPFGVTPSVAAYERRISFCSAESFVGIFTSTWTSRSPVRRPALIPFPSRRSTACGWVPAGSLSSSSLVEGRHRERVAERGLDERDRERQHQVEAVALKDRVLEHAQHDQQIPGRAARARARHPLAAHPQDVALLDPRRDRDLDGLFFVHLAAPRAGLARFSDHAPLAAAGRAGGADGEKAALAQHLPLAAAGRAGLDVLGGLGAGALAVRADRRALQLDLPFHAAGGLDELQVDLVAQVRAAVPGLARAAEAEEVAEDVAERAEDVLRRGVVAEVRPLEPGHRRGGRRARASGGRRAPRRPRRTP